LFRPIVKDADIVAEISVLNAGHFGCGLLFVLASTDRTINSDWFPNVSSKMT